MLANFHKHNNQNPPDSSIKKKKENSFFFMLFKNITQVLYISSSFNFTGITCKMEINLQDQ